MLSVKVPADAKVFVNDRATTSTGTDREYVSHDLAAGARYNYNVRAEFERDGKTVTENKIDPVDRRPNGEPRLLPAPGSANGRGQPTRAPR